ncbi:type II toxin-antitoxin system Phd/YefM family antitoxin [Thermodesulfitimonas autotrophica]|uniref:type II toxin-antitoxin system Phd/YefM family antitoxin n=1 Tax=Thermodesulfitimonas autotrophica TaxID=1894989 RepID=UPI002FE2FE00
MERIAGVNDIRPKLSYFLDSVARGEPPVVITINSEPKAVLVSCEEYRALRRAVEENKRMALKLALADLRIRAASSGITEGDVEKEIQAFRAEA